MLSAVIKIPWIDYLVRGITFLGVSCPNFWVGLLLMLAFCVRINLFPVICSGGDFKSYGPASAYAGDCHVSQIHQTGPYRDP